MKIYLAHPVTGYGTEQQAMAIALIGDRGFDVENPDQPHHQEAYRARGMQHFEEVVEDCDGLAFLRFPNGSIGAGVAKEIETALRRGLPVWDASSGELRLTGTMMPTPILSIDETRATIARIRAEAGTTGQRLGEWVKIFGYIDPPPAPKGYRTEVARDSLLGIVKEYRYVVDTPPQEAP